MTVMCKDSLSPLYGGLFKFIGRTANGDLSYKISSRREI